MVYLVNQSLTLMALPAVGTQDAGYRITAVTEADTVLLASSGMFINGLTRTVYMPLHKSTVPGKFTAVVHGKSGKLTRAWQTVQVELS